MVPLDGFCLYGRAGPVYPLAGFVFDPALPIIGVGDAGCVSAVRDGEHGEPLPLKLRTGQDHDYFVVYLGKRRVVYGQLVLFAVWGQECPGEGYVVHHEAYRADVPGASPGRTVGDDAGELEWLTREEHARRHALGRHGRR